MFTGIIESIGTVEEVTSRGSGFSYTISSPISHELKPDQSVSHEGVCLTVEKVLGRHHQVTAVLETLSKTNLGRWKPGTRVNLERCLQFNGRLDGHLVQGHVDATGTCVSIKDLQGSWEFRFTFPAEFAPLVIEKGSICVNGISLTAFNVTENEFSVAIIPFTYEHTSLSGISVGNAVNLEFDVIGKYLQRSLSLARQQR
jgi:riboflavin synthase